MGGAHFVCTHYEDGVIDFMTVKRWSQINGNTCKKIVMTSVKFINARKRLQHLLETVIH